MPSLIDENTQFIDESTSVPIVNGYIYIGVQNQDPVLNPITIYSDRELTTTLSNPQRTGADGRSQNKIWVPGKYSLVVQDASGSQKLADLDAGELAQTGVSNLSNIVGVNTITADASPPLTLLVDKEIYNFTAVGNNTGAVTLQIDTTAAKSVVKYGGTALIADDIVDDQAVTVIWNETGDFYELLSTPNTFAPVTVANHIRAGNTQYYSSNTTTTLFNVNTSITVDTWESVGPTGSGADNIWAEMDVLPSSARMLIVLLDHFISPSSTTLDANYELFIVDGSVTTPVKDREANLIYDSTIRMDNTSDKYSETKQMMIPLDSNQVFKVYYEQVNVSSTNNILFYRGFMTDD